VWLDERLEFRISYTPLPYLGLGPVLSLSLGSPFVFVLPSFLLRLTSRPTAVHFSSANCTVVVVVVDTTTYTQKRSRESVETVLCGADSC
jgi:hypothetical protein